jgi:tRNA threonylcarbamoyladenosine biosynthesis protein TsaE
MDTLAIFNSPENFLMKIKYIAMSTEQTEECGRQLAKLLDERGITRHFIAMRGEMGVGKTAFTRGFASYFGINGVKSPTYTVLNEYSGRVKIHHFDLYRIEDEDDLYSIGYDDAVESEGYSIAEWSENLPSAIPSDAITVTISRLSFGFDSEDQRANHRNIEIELPFEAEVKQ